MLHRRHFLAGASAGALLRPYDSHALTTSQKLLLLSRRAARPAVLPAGAVGVWYADTYSATPRPQIPNAANNNAVASSLLPQGRRQFSLATFRSGVVVTDANATAPDGTNDASTIVGTGNWSIGWTFGLTAVTVTVACNVKSGSGSNEQFKFKDNSTGSLSPTKTATTSWQRFSFSYTATTGGDLVMLTSFDGATGANLLVCDFEVFVGAVDLGPIPYSNQAMILGLETGASVPTYASGAITLTSALAFAALPSASTSTMTVIAILSKVAAGDTYQGIFAGVGGAGYLSFGALMEKGGGYPATDFNGVAGQIPTANAGSTGNLTNFLNAGWHMQAWRYDGAKLDNWVDQAIILSKAGTPSAVTDADFWIGQIANTSFRTGYKLHALLVYRRALSNAEIRSAYNFLKTRAALSSITLATQRIYVAEGDSITAGTGGSNPYPYVFGPNASPVVHGSVQAVSGAKLNNNSGNSLVERGAFIDSMIPPLPADRLGKKYILSVLIGANDLGAYTGGAAQYLIDYAAYCDARRAAGWLVVVCTILPISGNATFNSRRATVNAAITSSWTGVHCDAVADFAANSTMGTDTSFTDHPADWIDSIHPNVAGHIILETVIRPVINGL